MSKYNEGQISNPEELQDLIQEAAKLKTAQLDYKRREFMSSPQFMQDTLYPADDVKAVRLAPFEERMEKAVAFKTQGNMHFKDADFSAATAAYGQAVSVFRYFEEHGEDRFLKDDTNDLSEQEVAKRRELLVACLLNLAACALKTHTGNVAMYACQQALGLEPLSAKALYRRAMAHVELEAAEGSTCLDRAVGDLQKACSLDPNNKELRAALCKFSKIRKERDATDRNQFGGMFGRGELYSAEESVKHEVLDSAPIPGAVQRDGLWFDSESGRLLI
mmetsp:Transcript_47840/g.89070  ORF Transcript_47840/g.89070 Transcript_47840/m.89070 type:complete len:276 (+) Transcript_47840:116-943(+)